MAYQVKTTTSYGQRVSNSFKGIASGFLMFIIGTILLFWNEGNFIKTKRLINEVDNQTIRVDDVSTIDPSINGKTIHASAFADTKDVLTDGLFGVSETAISISRRIEYYQYKEKTHTEKRDKIGGGEETITTYTYEKDWSSSPINSASFADPDYKSSNFILTEVDPKTERAQNVSFGAYKLPSFLISDISGPVQAGVNLTPDQVQQWEKVISDKASALGFITSYYETVQYVHVSGNVVYFGKTPSVPNVGDVRVTLTKVLPKDISIVAKVNGNTFEKYLDKNNRAFYSVSMGVVSAEAMFAHEHASNSVWTWIFRILGIILVIGGLKSMFSILPTLFKVLPFLGNIVGAGVGLVCSVVGFAWSLLIIGISWLWYRPLIGIIFLAIAVAGIWFLKSKAKAKNS